MSIADPDADRIARLIELQMRIANLRWWLANQAATWQQRALDRASKQAGEAAEKEAKR